MLDKKTRIRFLGEHSLPIQIVESIDALFNEKSCISSCDARLQTESSLIQNARLSLSDIEWAIVDTVFIEIARKGGVNGFSKCQPEMKYHARFKSNFVHATALHKRLLESGDTRYQRTRLVALSSVNSTANVETLDEYKKRVSLLLGYLNQGFDKHAISA